VTTAFVFAELDSANPESDRSFLCCDCCFESSLGDCCGDEVRPFYRVVEDGLPYVVCLACLDQWMEGTL
jgi:hypothetical protein